MLLRLSSTFWFSTWLSSIVSSAAVATGSEALSSTTSLSVVSLVSDSWLDVSSLACAVSIVSFLLGVSLLTISDVSLTSVVFVSLFSWLFVSYFNVKPIFCSSIINLIILALTVSPTFKIFSTFSIWSYDISEICIKPSIFSLIWIKAPKGTIRVITPSTTSPNAPPEKVGPTNTTGLPDLSA